MDVELIPETIKTLAQLSIKQYVDLCDCLMGYSPMDYKEKANWASQQHGGLMKKNNFR